MWSIAPVSTSAEATKNAADAEPLAEALTPPVFQRLLFFPSPSKTLLVVLLPLPNPKSFASPLKMTPAEATLNDGSL